MKKCKVEGCDTILTPASEKHGVDACSTHLVPEGVVVGSFDPLQVLEAAETAQTAYEAWQEHKGACRVCRLELRAVPCSEWITCENETLLFKTADKAHRRVFELILQKDLPSTNPNTSIP